MNAEKELLLALLIEKYTAVKEIKPALHKQQNTVINRKQIKNRHIWTDQEKRNLLNWYETGASFYEIAKALNLRVKQVTSMHNNMQRPNYPKPVQHV